jgi:hypothetical protein
MNACHFHVVLKIIITAPTSKVLTNATDVVRHFFQTQSERGGVLVSVKTEPNK